MDGIPPGARDDDPETSHWSSGDSADRAVMRLRLLRAWAQHPDLNDYEAAIAADIDPNAGNCYWKRAGELRATGLIEVLWNSSGKAIKRPGQFDNHPRQVSRITDMGRRYLQGAA